jgi:hypothetical protein
VVLGGQASGALVAFCILLVSVAYLMLFPIMPLNLPHTTNPVSAPIAAGGCGCGYERGGAGQGGVAPGGNIELGGLAAGAQVVLCILPITPDCLPLFQIVPASCCSSARLFPAATPLPAGGPAQGARPAAAG